MSLVSQFDLIVAMRNFSTELDLPYVASRCNHAMTLSCYNCRRERRCDVWRFHRSIVAVPVTATSVHKVNGSRRTIAPSGCCFARQ